MATKQHSAAAGRITNDDPRPATGEAGRALPAFHIPSLDGIRAVSFAIVFLSHAGLEGRVPGYFGLTLFFFLSGYLITTLLRIEHEGTGRVSLKQFYLRRALRILPPFYLILIASTLLSLAGVLGGAVTAAGFWAQMFHLTNYWIVWHGWWEGMAAGTWVYWSLAVEEHFYLFFPLLFLFLMRRVRAPRVRLLVLLSICAAVLAWRCILVFGLDATKERTYVASDTRVDSILAGCVLAIWKNPVLDRALIDEKRLLWVGLPVGALLVLVSLWFREPWFEQTLRYSLQSFGLLPFFAAAIIWYQRWPFRPLNYRPIRYLGALSYSLYLMHTSVLWVLMHKTSLGILLINLVALAFLVSSAAAIHRFVEKPCGRLRRRLSPLSSSGSVA